MYLEFSHNLGQSITDILKQRGQCTLSDIALHFDTDANAVRGILDVWIRKGKVEKRSVTASCGSSCQSCDPATTEIYIWHESNGNKTINVAIDAVIPGNCTHK